MLMKVSNCYGEVDKGYLKSRFDFFMKFDPKEFGKVDHRFSYLKTVGVLKDQFSDKI